MSFTLATGMRHDEMRLIRWKQVDFASEAIKVGRSKTEHGAGRSVPLNKRATGTLTEWATQFPDRKPKHYLFPSERLVYRATTRSSTYSTRIPPSQSRP
jgi:integrase